MDYKELQQLIHNTLSGKASSHEITPVEHENLLMNVLDYARTMQVTGPSVLRGFAFPDTYPDMPDNYKVCYIAMISAADTDREVTFNHFLDDNGNAITVECLAGTVKYVTLLWNMEYWEVMECVLGVENN